MKKTLLRLLLTLAMISPAAAMTTYTDQWMWGTTLYAQATTEDQYDLASADLQIVGPSGSSYFSWDCSYYYSNVTTSLTVTGPGTYTAYSTHWVGLVVLWVIANTEVRTPWTNYKDVGDFNGNCIYIADCPGVQGGVNFPLCAPHQETDPMIGGTCQAKLNTSHLAVKYPLLGNYACHVQLHKSQSQHAVMCTGQ